MFLDDDPNEVTEIQNIPYINLGSPLKDGKNWEYPVLEREEGELTPDLYSATHSDATESKSTLTKKPPSKESNSEFLNKVNRCFRHLEKEFSNMHVPRGSKRFVTHLRSILCVVERMKRKLSILIDSASLSSKDNQGRVSSDFKNKAHSSQSSKDRERKGNDGTRKTENSHKSHGREFSKENGNPSSLHDSVGIHSRHGESRAKVDNSRRMPISTPYSKVERQRIQSLFKRQMSLITQQIIQQNDQDKHPKSGKHSGAKLKLEKFQQSRPNLEHLTTLEDMENFLELLKTKKGEKITPIDLIQNYQKKHVLKFTTKKRSSTPRARTLPVLLTGSKEDEDVVPIEVIKPKNNPLQVHNSKKMNKTEN
ncbi:uncharacterized protein TNIN_389201 [Trichonephila inaurata madagascariensis]|uniref:Uncharacterized protein n=1 Tax=Trichonephila inaurata madagascariensis TaxID=2747483 RepID=A0A8X6IC95_9ARAC|nr:uncharacterized protein TNIN_389201 [Trichonephila inaurata madagascariensis]